MTTSTVQSTNIKVQSIPTSKGLAYTYLDILPPKGAKQTIKVKLDTFSNITFVHPSIGWHRNPNSWEPNIVKGIGNQTILLASPMSLIIMRDKLKYSLDAREGPQTIFEDGTMALIGFDHIKQLGIDMNHVLNNLIPTKVKYLVNTSKNTSLVEATDKLKSEMSKKASTNVVPRNTTLITVNMKQFISQALSYKQLYEMDITPQRVIDHESATCYIAERLIREYNLKHTREFDSVPILIESMDKSDQLTSEQLHTLSILNQRYANVFAKQTNTLPRPMTNVKPHCFFFKKNAKPIYHKMPRFSAAKQRYLDKWRRWALSVRLISKSFNSRYASRLHIAPKYKASSDKNGVPDGLRPCWAGTDINDMMEKTVPTYPNPLRQLYRAARYKYKFVADGLKQYWSILLAPKAREVTSFWLPDGNLYKFNRLIMGTKNAATVAQNAYTDAMNRHMPHHLRDNLVNFADDFIGGANTIEELLTVYEAFLKMCQKATITLNPSKMRFGYQSETFYGHRLENGTMTPADRNLSPIKNMVKPNNISELRSIMGIFNQFAPFIKNYAREGNPASKLNKLLRKDVPFIWTQEQDTALESLRHICLNGVTLHTPNPTIPLILESDGSDDGWGAVLYQMVDGQRKTIRLWSKTWDKAWLNKPPYHKEAKAWMNAMELAKPYHMDNHHPLQCYTDHTPLTWIKHTSGKGPVSQFILDNLSEIDYDMYYLKGTQNVIADALSRFPLLGPRVLRKEGSENALNILLTAITNKKTVTKFERIWFTAGKDTKYLLPKIQKWINAMHKSMQNKTNNSTTTKVLYYPATPHKVVSLKYDLAILMPPADKIVRTIKALYAKDVSFALLMPSDLVNQIYITKEKIFDEILRQKVESSQKISLLGPTLVWLIHNLPLLTTKTVYATIAASQTIKDMGPIEPDITKLTNLANAEGLLPRHILPSRKELLKLQKLEQVAKEYNPKHLLQSTDGFLYYNKDINVTITSDNKHNVHPRVIPKSVRDTLIRKYHNDYCHINAKKLFNRLKAHFHWHGMSKDISKIVDQCKLCNLLKANRNLANKYFRAKLFCMPHTAYGMDYYGVYPNQEGYDNILGIIDLASGNLVLKPTKGRTAATTSNALLYGIVVNKGVPLLLHSDNAKEFLYSATAQLASILGCKQTSTKGHNPRANAKIERVWAFIANCLRTMTDKQYHSFHLYLPLMAFVWNTTPDADTNTSPFEVEHSVTARTPANSYWDKPPSKSSAIDAEGIDAIAQSTHAIRKIIAQTKAQVKVETAKRLNSLGKSKIKYRIGQKVKFFMPPTAKQAKLAGRKPKHLKWWAGPATIVEQLSRNGTTFRMLFNKNIYERHVINIQPWRGNTTSPNLPKLQRDDTISIGSMVAVLDDDEDKHYHLAQVLDITNDEITLWYAATKSKKLKSARWRLLYRDPIYPDTNYRYSDQSDIYDLRFTGKIDNLPVGKGLIPLANIAIKDKSNPKSFRIDNLSMAILRELQLTHHSLDSTWKFPGNH